MKRDTAIYFDDKPIEYQGSLMLGGSGRKELNDKARALGYVGCLSGFTWWDSKTHTVLVFFKEKPSAMEIDKRRNNGFLSAKWFYL